MTGPLPAVAPMISVGAASAANEMSPLSGLLPDIGDNDICRSGVSR